MIRHPDLPAEAFRDLGATIQSGLAWQGMVKNRRKSGDHQHLQAIVGDLRSQVGGPHHAPQEIAAGSGHLSARTESQAGVVWDAVRTVRP